MRILAALVAAAASIALSLGNAEDANSASAPDGGAVPVTVERVAGDDRYATAGAVARDTFDDVTRVYLVTGRDFPDALAAGAAAGAHGAPVLLTARDRLPGATRTALASLDPREVVVVGGIQAVGDEVAMSAAEVGDASVRRVAGRDRIRTAARVADELVGEADVVYLATGDVFADGLAASPLAAMDGAPLLLTSGDRLPAATSDAIKRLDPERVEVLGGTTAVPSGVVDEVRALTRATVTRHAGADRFATAARVVDAKVQTAERVHVATGTDFADALTGAPAAATQGAPLLLTSRDRLPDAAAATLARLAPSRVTVLGGTRAVSDAVASASRDAAAGALSDVPGSGPEGGHADEDEETSDGDGLDEREPPDDDEADATCDRTFSGRTVESGGFTVPAGETWCFDPARTTTVETEENVVVRGTFRMKPRSADVVHTLKFVGVDETAFQGGHTEEPIPSDVGLWVVEDGQLDLQGTERAGWNRTGDDPTWRAGDEIRRAPIERGETKKFPEFAPGSQVPSVTAPDGSVQKTEVFNLTRNVRIHGGGSNPPDEVLSDDGRAHVICLECNKPQTLRYVELRWVGPRALDERTETDGLLGRYGVHFHHNGDGSRGSFLEGVVVRDAGNHAFVPHASHGITFRDTVSFDTFESAYWWDENDETHDVLYERAAAFLTQDYPSPRGYSLDGFNLGEGRDMTVRDSVVVGNHGHKSNSGGFHWPSDANQGNNVWTFHGNVAHNNRGAGLSVWQNDSNQHTVEGYIGYHNGRGILHGAYRNNYTYRDSLLFGNDRDLVQSALSRDQLLFEGLDVGTVRIGKHSVPSDQAVVYRNVRVREGVTIAEADNGGQVGGVIRFDYDCDHAAIALTPSDFHVLKAFSRITLDDCTSTHLISE